MELKLSPWRFNLVIEPDEDGGYIVHCPALKGCWSQGETVEEALQNIKDAMIGWVTVHLEKSFELSSHNVPTQLTEPLTLAVQVV